MNNTIDTLCIGGGGLKGFSFLSALNVLISHNYINLDLINTYTGTSFGSIFCFLLSIGYTTEELITYFNNFDKKDLDINLDLELFLSKYGFNDGNNYLDLVITLFNLKTKLKDITFKDLEILTKKKIYIIVTNFTKGQKEVFSAETTPYMSVLLAIRMSISIPFILTPVIYNDNYYIDGCLTSNFGIEYCNLKTTLCICLQKPKCFNYDNISNIISGIMTIAIIKEIKNLKKLEIIQNDFTNVINANDEYFKNLLNIGTKSGLKFLKKEYILRIKEKEHELKLLKENELKLLKDNNCQKDNNLLSNEIENIQEEYKKVEFEETIIVNKEQYELDIKPLKINNDNTVENNNDNTVENNNDNTVENNNDNTVENNNNETTKFDIMNKEVKNYIYELINLIDNKII